MVAVFASYLKLSTVKDLLCKLRKIFLKYTSPLFSHLRAGNQNGTPSGLAFHASSAPRYVGLLFVVYHPLAVCAGGQHFIIMS